jgi:hypothetical protein
MSGICCQSFNEEIEKELPTNLKTGTETIIGDVCSGFRVLSVSWIRDRSLMSLVSILVV